MVGIHSQDSGNSMGNGPNDRSTKSSRENFPEGVIPIPTFFNADEITVELKAVGLEFIDPTNVMTILNMHGHLDMSESWASGLIEDAKKHFEKEHYTGLWNASSLQYKFINRYSYGDDPDTYDDIDSVYRHDWIEVACCLPKILSDLPSKVSSAICYELLKDGVDNSNFGLMLDRDVEYQHIELTGLYIAIKINTILAKIDDISNEIKKIFNDYFILQLSKTSWVYVEPALYGLLSYAKETENTELYDFVHGVLKNKNSLLEEAERFIRLEDQYNSGSSYYSSLYPASPISLEEKDRRTELAKKVVRIFKQKVLYLTDPNEDSTRKNIWSKPVESVLDAMASMEPSIIVLESPGPHHPYDLSLDLLLDTKIGREFKESDTTAFTKLFIDSYVTENPSCASIYTSMDWIVGQSKLPIEFFTNQRERSQKAFEDGDNVMNQIQFDKSLQHFFLSDYTLFETYLRDVGQLYSDKVPVAVIKFVSFVNYLKGLNIPIVLNNTYPKKKEHSFFNNIGMLKGEMERCLKKMCFGFITELTSKVSLVLIQILN